MSGDADVSEPGNVPVLLAYRDPDHSDVLSIHIKFGDGRRREKTKADRGGSSTSTRLHGQVGSSGDGTADSGVG